MASGIKIGKRYRDKIMGVVGEVIAGPETDPEGKKVLDGGEWKFVPVTSWQMRLDDCHVENRADPVEHASEPKVHDKRWYAEERLEPVDA